MLLTACVPLANNTAGTAIPASPAPVPPVNAADNNPAPDDNPQAGDGEDAAVAQLLLAEDYDEAIARAKAAFAAMPSPSPDLRQNLADAYIARAWFYKSKRLTTYTLADLSSALYAAPDYYRAHYEMGRFHNNQWQFSIGLWDLNKAIALKPDFAPAYSERAYSQYKNQKYEPALDDVNKAIMMDPADPGFYCNRSLIHAATGKLDLALEDANRAVQVSPSNASAYYHRGLVYIAAGKADMAAADMQKTLELSGDDLLSARANAELQKLQK